MYSSLISKIEKAKRYAEERDRVEFQSFSVAFRGDHDTYKVTLTNGRWACTCSFFSSGYNTCSHVMALQRILGNMAAPVQAELAPPRKMAAG